MFLSRKIDTQAQGISYFFFVQSFTAVIIIEKLDRQTKTSLIKIISGRVDARSFIAKLLIALEASNIKFANTSRIQNNDK